MTAFTEPKHLWPTLKFLIGALGGAVATAPLAVPVTALWRLLLGELNALLGKVTPWTFPIPDWPSPPDAALFAVATLAFFWLGSLMDVVDAWEGHSHLRTTRGWLRYIAGGTTAVLTAGTWITLIIFLNVWLVLAALLLGGALHVGCAYWWQRREQGFVAS